MAAVRRMLHRPPCGRLRGGPRPRLRSIPYSRALRRSGEARQGANTYQNAFSAAQLAEQQAPSYRIAGGQPGSHAGGDRRLAPGDNPIPACRTSLRHLAAEQRPHRHHGAWRFCRCGDGYRQRYSSCASPRLAERVGRPGSRVGAASRGGGPVSGGPPVRLKLVKPRAAAQRADLPAQDHRSGPRAGGRACCWADSGDPAGEDGPEGADRRRGPIEHRMQLRHKRRRHGRTGRIAHPPGRVAHPPCGPWLVGGRVVPQAPPRAGSRPERPSCPESRGSQLGAGRLRPRGRHQPCACPGGSRFLGATGGRRRARWPDGRSLRHGQPARAHHRDQRRDSPRVGFPALPRKPPHPASWLASSGRRTALAF